MRSSDALIALDYVNGKATISDEAAAALLGHGLLIEIDLPTATMQSRKISGLDALIADIGRIETRLATAETERDSLQWWSDSKLYRFGSTVWNMGFAGVNATDSALESKTLLVDILNSDIALAKSQRTELEALKADYEKLVPTGERFVRLSDEGLKIRAYLAARIARVGNLELDVFMDELAKVRAGIAARIESFRASSAAVTALGFKNDPDVAQYALTVSMLPGDDLEAKLSRAGAANSRIYNAGFKSYDRLAVATAIAAYSGDIGAICDEVFAIYEIMRNDGHGASISTLSEAAAIYGIPGESPELKYRRSEAIDEALSERGWKRRSAATGFISARLARRAGDPVEIAAKHRALEDALIAAGRNNSTESGIAALILLNFPGSDEERARKHQEALEAMVRYGYEKTKSNYATAASLVLTPGTFDENAHLLQEVTSLLKQAGYKNNLLGRSLAIIGGAYRDFVRTEHVQYTSDSPSITPTDAPDNTLLYFMAVMLYLNIASMNDCNASIDGNVAGSAALDFSSTDIGTALASLDLGTLDTALAATATGGMDLTSTGFTTDTSSFTSTSSTFDAGISPI